jgi:hypothetical protein
MDKNDIKKTIGAPFGGCFVALMAGLCVTPVGAEPDEERVVAVSGGSTKRY